MHIAYEIATICQLTVIPIDHPAFLFMIIDHEICHMYEISKLISFESLVSKLSNDIKFVEKYWKLEKLEQFIQSYGKSSPSHPIAYVLYL